MENAMVERCVRIERPLYDQQQLRNDYNYQKRKHGKFGSDLVRRRTTGCDPCAVAKSALPVLDWLPAYKWREYFPLDVISGFTVAVMHISQGIPYGILANTTAVVGLYTSFFPVLMYFLFGTCRHNSMGTFAVVCLMTGKVVLEHADQLEDGVSYTQLEVATAVTFSVAVIHLSMYIFRLGIISSLLSETLVSGFTTGAAVQVLISQFKDVLGIPLPKSKGYFVNIKTLESIFLYINEVNYVAIGISTITIVGLVACNECVKPRIAKLCTFPLPVELVAIVVGTLTSALLDLNENYGINIVGSIPSGLPVPILPPLALFPRIWMDALMIALVSYTISLSMGLIFAQRLNYEVDANQELLALGVSNLFGSFFSCVPFSASLSRSSIQESVGGKTQLVSLVSCSVLLVILMWIGPYFEALPKCVLASVIIVALKPLLLQVRDLCAFWSLSKLDAMVWCVTFLAVTLIAIDIGLMVGIAMSLVCIFVRGLKPYTCLLGWVPQTDLYLDVKRYMGVKELMHIKIFHYQGSINFASKNFFKAELYEAVQINPSEVLAMRKKGDPSLATDESMYVKCIVLDFAALSYIDPSGVTMLKLLAQEFQRIDIPIVIGGCSEPIYETMCRCDLINNATITYYKVFPTVHDAVQYANDKINSLSIISRL